MISFAVLSTEISLTRMFSVMFAYHYAFLAVAIAFAGLGLGGILAQLFFSGEPSKELISGMTIVYTVFALVVSLFTIIAASSSPPNFIAASILFFISFLPAGLFLATVYKSFARYSSALYGADIAGTALGSIAPISFLNGLNPIITILVASSLLSITSLSLGLISLKRKKICATAIIALLIISSALFLSISSGKDISIGSDQGKELYGFLNDPAFNATIVETRWSAFGRTDLVEFQNDPHSKVIFIDGGAGTQVYHFNGDFADTSSTVYPLRFSTAAYPFYFSGKGSTLIVGAGGGVDVLTTLMFNFTHIHAIEINQETVDMVKEYSDFDGGIYTDYSNVHVHVDEGRSFLKRMDLKYDVIMFNIPVTKTIQGSSGYSMAENYLFTTDSFKDFFNNLKDDGYLVIRAHERVEIYKLVATALEALMSQGKSVQEVMSQLVVAENMGHPMFPVLILKKTPFASVEATEMLAKSNELNLNPVYFPFTDSPVKQTFDQALVGMADGKMDLNALIVAGSSNGIDIGPSSDDRPFFYKFENGLPFTLPQLLTGFIVLVAVVTFSYLLAGGRRIYLASKKMKQVVAGKFSIFTPYYFASLGLGFMLIEVSFVQKFILFLGPPTVAISVVLFSLLLSMGIGGFFSRRGKESASLALRACLYVGIILILYVFTLPLMFNSFLSLDLSVRLIMTFVLTFPVGFLLGIPFPVGIKIVNEKFDGNDVPWMWGINGLYSLLGSTVAVIIAMLYGFSATLLAGGAVYLAIFLIGRLYFNE